MKTPELLKLKEAYMRGPLMVDPNEVIALIEELLEARKVVAWYADKNQWKESPDRSPHTSYLGMVDCGDKARAHLAKFGGSKDE